MEKTTEEKNKALVLEAFNAAFNERSDSAYERYWSPDYIQHSSHIPPGRDGLRGLIEACPPDMKYESALIMAEGDFVMVHGRFTNIGQPKAWIALDIVRIENGLLAEHWDVIEDEASQAESVSGLPMFGNEFGTVPLSS
jgi:predicted SnoaL-like aldol condensation-catalyzing enzyme